MLPLQREQRRNTGVLHFIQDDGVKMVGTRRQNGGEHGVKTGELGTRLLNLLSVSSFGYQM